MKCILQGVGGKDKVRTSSQGLATIAGLMHARNDWSFAMILAQVFPKWAFFPLWMVKGHFMESRWDD